MLSVALRTAPLAGLLAALLLVPASGIAGRDRGAAENRPDKPQLTLRADPSVGFTPVYAVLSAELTGVDPSDPNFCHPAVIWVRIDPGKSEETASRLRQDPVCRHGREDAVAPTHFTRQFTLIRPGPYLFRLVIAGKDGREIRSDYARIRVVRVQ